MSEENSKILLLDYGSESTEKIKSIFQSCEITTAANLKEISEKGNDKYDLIITGLIVPQVSDDKFLTSLKDIDQSIKKFESAIKGKKPREQIVKQFCEKHDQILQLLNKEVKGFIKEKDENKEALKNKVQEIVQIKEKLEQEQKDAQTA